MSSGSAITVSERNIENIKSPPMIFGGPKNEGLVHGESPIAFEVENPSSTTLKHVPNPGEKFQMKHGGEAGDGRTNNVLQPARNENMKVNAMKKSIAEKPEQSNNYIIPNKHPISMAIGASGDGFGIGEKPAVPICQNSNSVLNHQEMIVHKELQHAKKQIAPENAIISNKTGMQTYAKVAQNLPANSKTADIKTDNVSLLRKSATTSTNGQGIDPSPMVNGVKEDDTPSPPVVPPSNESTTSLKTSENKALKETIGHVSRLPDDPIISKSGNEPLSVEQDIQILSNPERTAEDSVLDAHQQQQYENPAVNPDADFTSSKLSGGSSRRETEKPPRMQKQRSQDRLLMKQQKPSFDSDTKRETLSRESSVECVDSTGVDVHEFLITTLRNSTRDRAILLKIEHDMIGFVNNKTSDFMKFPPMTSYHRMLVHRVAAYFGMDHNVDETGRSVIINKTNTTRLPEVRFADQFDHRQPDQPSGRRDDDMRRRSILKRTNQSRSFDRDDMKGGSLWKDRQRSIEEREEQYEKARARIFNNPEANMNSPPMYGRRAMSSLAAARMAGWSDRPWNSSDMDPSMRMPGPRLTTRASSYSSVLPRHNSATSVKTGSSSSVSSMNGINGNMQNFGQGRQTHGMGMRPPTPSRRNGMGDNGNGAYYYMQPQNQDVPFDAVEDDIAQSWFPESPESLTPCNSEVIVPTDAPILLAVPYGTTLPPETVLCHPITGMPYLSPEGYQLVYQSGPPPVSVGNGGMASPQFARYYQIPPSQPSPQHPGMPYPHGYNPYEESPHKAQGSTNTDYTMMSPMSSYPHNISSTSTVYSGVQGQPSISYAYQPAAVYRPTSEPPMAVTPSQTGMQSVSQGKQTPIMQQAGQGYIQQSSLPATVSYPPYMVAPPQGQPPQHQGSSKDGPVAGTTTPRNMVAQQVPSMQHAPNIHMGHQPMPPVFSPPTGPNQTAHPNSVGQGMQNEPPKSSTLSQEGKKTTEDELNEKMQAIVLKNLQQQQVKQLPDTSASEFSNTVTTTFSPSNNPNQNSKPVPETANHPHTGNVANQTRHRHPPEPHGYAQYQYMNGMQQPQQQMQVYLMPTNNAASYRTYSQFMSQPQAPHVMGPGMHFVYLSPPPMAGGITGIEGSPALNIGPNAQVYQTNQTLANQSQSIRQTLESSNTNNNNATKDVHNQGNLSETTDSKSIEVEDGEKELNTGRDVMADEVELAANVTVPNGVMDDASLDDNEDASETSSDQTGETEEQKADDNHERKDVSSGKDNEQIITSQTNSPPAVSSNEQRSSSHSSVMTSISSKHTAYDVHSHPVVHHQHPSTPVLLSNVPHDYRIAGMNMASPVSYPPGMIPQYSMYPNIGPGPYVYLPTATPATATTARSPKLPDMKMFPQAAAHHSHSPGLVAVQIPNQNQIQLVPAASLQHQNQIYYAPPHGYMTSDYTNHAQASAYPSAKPEVTSQPENNLQANETVTAKNVTPQQVTEDETSPQVSHHSVEQADSTGPASGSVDITPKAQ